MFSRHFAIVVLAAVIGACGDTPTQSVGTFSPTSEPAAVQSYPGILVAPNLLRSGTTMISLAGWQTRLFQALVGAEILIEGRMDTDPLSGIEITDFQVLAIDGIPVVDGMLEWTEDGYFVRARAGRVAPVYEVPEALALHVGRRVYVALDGGFTVRFGLLELDE